MNSFVIVRDNYQSKKDIRLNEVVDYEEKLGGNKSTTQILHFRARQW